MLVLASQQQEQECGDGTNFVLVFAGALLEQAEQLLRMVCLVFGIAILGSSLLCACPNNNNNNDDNNVPLFIIDTPR